MNIDTSKDYKNALQEDFFSESIRPKRVLREWRKFNTVYFSKKLQFAYFFRVDTVNFIYSDGRKAIIKGKFAEYLTSLQ